MSSSVSTNLKKGLKKLNGGKKKKYKSKSKNPPLVVETTYGAKKNRNKKKGGRGLQGKKLENKNQQEEPQTPETFMIMFYFHSPCANDGNMDWMDNLYACAMAIEDEVTYSIMGCPDMKDHGRGVGGSGGKKRVAAVAAKHNVTTQ
jgi:hypothetical protein